MESDQSAGLLLGIVRAVRARDRGHLAAVLHDGPIQELAAATLELGLDGDATDGVAERQVAAAGRSLRALIEELAPFHQAGHGLPEALGRRTGWLLAGPLAVDLGEGSAGLSAAEIEDAADLAELMLLGAVGADAPARALATVRAGRDMITVEVNVSATADPADAAAWLEHLAAAMRTTADIEQGGHRLRARIAIPRR
jgi:hypothetical protein